MRSAERHASCRCTGSWSSSRCGCCPRSSPCRATSGRSTSSDCRSTSRPGRGGSVPDLELVHRDLVLHRAALPRLARPRPPPPVAGGGLAPTDGAHRPARRAVVRVERHPVRRGGVASVPRAVLAAGLPRLVRRRDAAGHHSRAPRAREPPVDRTRGRCDGTRPRHDSGARARGLRRGLHPAGRRVPVRPQHRLAELVQARAVPAGCAVLPAPGRALRTEGLDDAADPPRSPSASG